MSEGNAQQNQNPTSRTSPSRTLFSHPPRETPVLFGPIVRRPKFQAPTAFAR